MVSGKVLSMFKRKTVAGRMFMLVALTILFTAIMVATGFGGFKSLAGMIDLMHGDGATGLGYLAGAQNAMWQLRYGVSQYLAIPDPGARQEVIDESQKWFNEFDNDMKLYSQLGNGRKCKAALATLLEYYGQYRNDRPKWFALMQTGKIKEAADFRARTILISGAQTVSAFNKLMALQLDRISYLDKNSGKIVFAAKEQLAVMGIILSLAALLIASWISRGILGSLNGLSRNVDTMAKGDLRVRIEHSLDDEIGILGHHMDSMASAFGSIIDDISISVRGVASTVEALKKEAENAAEGARNQTSKAQQIAASAEEMNQTITDIASNASNASQSSGEMMDLVKGGKEVTGTTVEVINDVSASSSKLSAMIEKLDRSVGEIGDIVTVIKDIADQTNLLALNAAIEAARAGEQGRGFGVVADEVRKLAERTIKATTEISEKIGTVQAESGQTATLMKDASKGFSKAAGNVRNLDIVLDTIVESVQSVRDQIAQIATAVEEQSSASEEVVMNIEATAAISREMEKMAGNVLYQIENLSGIGNNLKKDVSGFITLRTAA